MRSAMRTVNTGASVAPSVPLLDASFLPAEEEWEVIEALHASESGFDDDDRLAGFGLSAGDFD
jgi:hypothetical protein